MGRHFGRRFAPALVILLAGCSYLQAVSFQEDDRSGKAESGKVALFALGAEGRPLAFRPENPEDDAGLGDALNKCTQRVGATGGESTEALPAVLIPIVAFAFEQILGTVKGQLEEELVKLRNDSKKSYEAHLITSRGLLLEEANCLVVVRGTFEEGSDTIVIKDVGLVAVLKIERFANSFRLATSYLRVDEARAKTGDDQPVSINLGIAVKAGGSRGPIREFGTVAQAALVVPGLKLEEASTIAVTTGLLPLPPRSTTELEVTVAVVETGSALPDLDKAKAELDALFRAVGPQLTGLVTNAVAGGGQ